MPTFKKDTMDPSNSRSGAPSYYGRSPKADMGAVVAEFLAAVNDCDNTDSAARVCRASRAAWFTFHSEACRNSYPIDEYRDQLLGGFNSASQKIRAIRNAHAPGPDRDIVTHISNNVFIRQAWFSMLFSMGIGFVNKILGNILDQIKNLEVSDQSRDGGPTPNAINPALIKRSKKTRQQ